MVFAYYQWLTPQQKAIYRQSDAMQMIILPRVTDAQRWVVVLEAMLKIGNHCKAQLVCAGLLEELTTVLAVSKTHIRVLARRPADAGGELQGLYELSEGASLARITVWMRTAQRKQLVAFRTFLRTVLHE